MAQDIGQDLPLDMGRRVMATLRGESYDIFIRGWAENRFIILDLPSVNGENIRVAPQTGCVVNYIRDGQMVSFRSSVIFSINQALSMMIEYPKHFEIFNLRKHERFRANFPMTYSYELAGKMVQEKGSIRDVSMKGFLISHDKPLAKKSSIFISATFADFGIENVECIVCNLKKRKADKDVFVTGLKIENGISPENQEALKNLLRLRSGADRRKQPRF